MTKKKSRIFWKCTFQVRDTVYLNFIAGRTLWIALKENTLIWNPGCDAAGCGRLYTVSEDSGENA